MTFLRCHGFQDVSRPSTQIIISLQLKFSSGATIGKRGFKNLLRNSTREGFRSSLENTSRKLLCVIITYTFQLLVWNIIQLFINNLLRVFWSHWGFLKEIVLKILEVSSKFTSITNQGFFSQREREREFAETVFLILPLSSDSFKKFSFRKSVGKSSRIAWKFCS